MVPRDKKQNGLSLLGVMLAIFIISIGLVAILSLISSSLNSSLTAKNEIIASGLAQEGIEMVRFMRASSANWDNWYDSIADGNYLVQHNTNYLLSYSDTPLRLGSSGLYQYDSGNNVIFYRKINIQKLSSDEIKVMAEIKWQERGEWKYLVAEDRLWKWQ